MKNIFHTDLSSVEGYAVDLDDNDRLILTHWERKSPIEPLNGSISSELEITKNGCNTTYEIGELVATCMRSIYLLGKQEERNRLLKLINGRD